MRAPPPDDLNSLEKGLVWGLLRLGGGLPVALRLDAAAQKRVSAALSRADHGGGEGAPAPELPQGLQHIHPSWLRYTLAREPLPVAACLVVALRASGLQGLEGPWDKSAPAKLNPGLQAELLRALFQPLSDPEPPPTGHFPDRTLQSGASPPGTSRAVIWQRLPGVVLWRALCERGASEVGRSLFRAEPVMRARAMATVGAPWAQVIARFAAGPVDSPARDRARLAMARASAMAAKTGVSLEEVGRPEAEVRLAFVGLYAAHNEIAAAGPPAVRTMALRLPVLLGHCLWAGGLGT